MQHKLCIFIYIYINTYIVSHWESRGQEVHFERRGPWTCIHILTETFSLMYQDSGGLVISFDIDYYWQVWILLQKALCLEPVLSLHMPCFPGCHSWWSIGWRRYGRCHRIQLVLQTCCDWVLNISISIFVLLFSLVTSTQDALCHRVFRVRRVHTMWPSGCPKTFYWWADAHVFTWVNMLNND